VNVEIKQNFAVARKAEADGEASFIRETGAAKGAEVEAIGMARAKAYEAQVRALGQDATAMVNTVTALADRGLKFVPEVWVSGQGGSMDGLAGSLMRFLQIRSGPTTPLADNPITPPADNP
jgi:hypothetical protein